jgi:two-component system, sensor histidine kinase and response regulator
LSRISTHIELKESRELLKQINAVLEEKVNLRTRELFEANQKLKDVNQELEKLDIAKSDFLNLISHEINTPLNGILGFGQVLKSKLSSTEYFDYIEYLMESANRLHQFAQDSLEITKMRTSPEKYRKEKIDINRILEELILYHSKIL